MTIFFEQARSKGLHFILANQTSASSFQGRGYHRCHRFMHQVQAELPSFRPRKPKTNHETSGEALYHSVAWTRVVHDAFNEQTPHLLSLAHALRNHRDDSQ